MGLTRTKPLELAWVSIDAHPGFDDDCDEAGETKLEADVVMWHERR